MHMKKNKLALLALAVIMLLALSACGSQNDGISPEDNPFVNMETVDLDGNLVDSSAFAENKLTLVNAWNLGCTPCIEEIPALDQLNEEYADKGVGVKGLYYNFGNELSAEDRTEISEILTKAEAAYPHLLASEAMMKTGELKRLATFPTTYFVDSEGNIVDKVEGSRDYQEWASLVDEMLEKVENHE